MTRKIIISHIVFFFYLLFLTDPALGQGLRAKNKVAPLKTGDSIPGNFWNIPMKVVSHPEGKQVITLAEYKNKLIILDFWATWCIPCVTSLNKLDTIQKEFGNSLAIVPVTSEDSARAALMFSQKGWNLPTIVDNRLLKEYFPHRSIPHQIWIKDGRVLSITDAAFGTRDNFTKALKGEKLKLITKEEDVTFDKTKPLLVDGNGGGAESMLYQSVVSKAINAGIGGERFRENHLACYNFSIGDIFQVVFQDTIPFTARYNRRLSLLNDSLTKRVFNPKYTDNNSPEAKFAFAQWKKDNMYCYSLQTPGKLSRRDMQQLAKNDLNRFFGLYLGINVRIETRIAKCMVIVIKHGNTIGLAAADKEPSYSNDNKNTWFQFVNQPFDHFLAIFEEQNKYSLPVVDQTGYAGNITMEFKGRLDDLPMVKRELNKNGFDLIEKELPINMLVYYSLK